MCEAAPVGVMDALLGDGEDALVGEEELLNRAVGRRVSAIRGISFKVRSIKGRDPSLGSVSCNALQAGRVRTYSHGCYLSIAVLGLCQKRMWIWARQGDVVLGAAVERLLAVGLSVSDDDALRRLNNMVPRPNPLP